MQRRDQLIVCLDRGFNVRNLYAMATICRETARDTAHPLPYFVLRHLFLDIAQKWEGIPLNAEEAEHLQDRLTGHIRDLLKAISVEAGPPETCRILDALVSEYLSA